MSRPFYTSTDLNNYPDFKEYAPAAYRDRDDYAG